MADDREIFENFVKDTKKTADKIGNGHRVTEKEIRDHCQKVAERAERNVEERRRKNGS